MTFTRKSTERVKTRAHDDKLLTEQSHKQSCDIHTIMRKYEKTGMVTHLANYSGQYMDMASAPDFQTAQTILAETRSMFETIPARIRADFDNDPGRFLDFIQNRHNREAIANYGFSTDHLPPVENPPAVPPTPAAPPAEE